MKSKAQSTARRLLAALEDMAQREAVLLDHGELDQVLELQGRMAPLVECVSELAPEVADDEMRRTALRLLDQRHENHVRIGRELSRLQLDRRKMSQTHNRLIRMGPTYGRADASRVFEAQG